MRFFLDTEFMEDGRSIELISIGVVTEDGREFYKQNANADLKKANPWVRDNVLPRLLPCPKGIIPLAHRAAPCRNETCPWTPYYLIGKQLEAFVGYSVVADPLSLLKPVFWGYYADYDWVALCFLFGSMVDLPQGWPMYCRDLKQWCDDLGNPKLPQQSEGEHNALADARWNREAWDFLWSMSQGNEIRREAEWEAYRGVARQRNKSAISAREINQESGHVRSPEEAGQEQVYGGGDQ